MERVSGQMFRNNLEFRSWVKARRACRARRVLYSLTITAGLGVTCVYAICGAVGQKEDGTAINSSSAALCSAVSVKTTGNPLDEPLKRGL